MQFSQWKPLKEQLTLTRTEAPPSWRCLGDSPAVLLKTSFWRESEYPAGPGRTSSPDLEAASLQSHITELTWEIWSPRDLAPSPTPSPQKTYGYPLIVQNVFFFLPTYKKLPNISVSWCQQAALCRIALEGEHQRQSSTLKLACILLLFLLFIRIFFKVGTKKICGNF